jgi:hypothetical protein
MLIQLPRDKSRESSSHPNLHPFLRLLFLELSVKDEIFLTQRTQEREKGC